MKQECRQLMLWTSNTSSTHQRNRICRFSFDTLCTEICGSLRLLAVQPLDPLIRNHKKLYITFVCVVHTNFIVIILTQSLTSASDGLTSRRNTDDGVGQNVTCKKSQSKEWNSSKYFKANIILHLY